MIIIVSEISNVVNYKSISERKAETRQERSSYNV